MGPGAMRPVLLALFALARGATSDCPPLAFSPQQIREQFRELNRKAQVEFRHGELAQAANDFRDAVCVAPASMRPYYELYEVATRAMATGDYAHARSTLEEAYRLRPDYALPLAMLVRLSLASGDADDLKESLLALAQHFPADGRLHAELARDLIHQKQYDLALAEGLRAEQSGSVDETSTINLAVLENQVGAFDDAVRHAIGIEEQTTLPDRIRASGAAIAGLSYESLGQLEAAVQHLRQAIQLDPGQENPYIALARIYERQHNSRAAIEVLQAGQTRRPDSTPVLLSLGKSLVAAEQFPAAIQTLAKVIQGSPDQLEAYPTLAEAYRKMGEPVLATAMLRKVAERKPDYPMLHVVIAQSMLDENPVDHRGVLQELALAEKASPNDYDVYYLRGKVYTSMHEYPQAVTALRRAIELRPTEAAAYYQLGLAYRKSGQLSLASKQFETVEYLKIQSTVSYPVQ
jgi:tetratricopeptide (TPR) repeat protein